MTIFPTETVATLTSEVTTAITDNIATVLGIFAFVVGISVVMALLDIAKEGRMLDNYGKRFK